MPVRPCYIFPRSLLGFGLSLLFVGSAVGQQFRVVSWNTANDVSATGGDTHPPTIGGPADAVLRAIGALSVTGSAPAHPIDVLALQESAINTGSGVNPTAQAYANILNNIYGAGTYAVAPLNGTTDGATVGNGPNSLVYRTTSLQLVVGGTTAVGTSSGSGPPRQVLQFEFQPIGYPASTAFYLYDDHFKSGTGTSNDDRRGAEATIITNAVNALPANTPIVFAGDYNPTNNTSDQGYHGVVTGSPTNHAVDPLNPTNATQDWSVSSALSMETSSPATTAAFSGQSTGGMNFRDDFLMNSPGMLNGNPIHYISGSFVSFGNTGNHNYQQAINTGSNSAAALASELSGMYTASQAAIVLNDLTQASDHLPVVADYAVTVVPEPSSFAFTLIGAAGIGYFRRRSLKSRQL